jgi:hypothetical protein
VSLLDFIFALLQETLHSLILNHETADPVISQMVTVVRVHTFAIYGWIVIFHVIKHGGI